MYREEEREMRGDIRSKIYI